MIWLNSFILCLSCLLQSNDAIQQDEDTFASPPPLPLIRERTEDQVTQFLANAPPGESTGTSVGLKLYTSSKFDVGNLFVVVFASCVCISMLAPGAYIFYNALQGTKLDIDSVGKGAGLLCLLSFAWILFIYSLAFSRNAHSYDVVDSEINVIDRDSASGSVFIGEFTHIGIRGLGPNWGGGNVRYPLRRVNDRIPHMMFMTFQMMVFLQCVVPLMVVAGKGIGRWSSISFWLLWSSCIYATLCYWTQGGGWLSDCIDAGAAVPVHLSIGFTALGLSFLKSPSDNFLGARFQARDASLGLLLWVMGSLFVAACRSAMISAWSTPDFLNLFLSGNAGLLTWLVIQSKYARFQENYPWLLGPMAGVVAISSGSASVSPGTAILVGVLGTLVTCMTLHTRGDRPVTMLWLLFAIHGTSAFAGLLATGVFASADVAGHDVAGKPIVGLLGGDFEQLRVQFLAASLSAFLSFAGSIVLLRVAQFFGIALERIFGRSAAADRRTIESIAHK